MALTANIKITEELKGVIEKRLREEVEKEFDEHIKKLERRKNEIIAGLLLNIKKTINIETLKDNIIFTIKEITN